jgi:hypothetical protein
MASQQSCGAFLMAARQKLAFVRVDSEKAQGAEGP